ncbi:polysaccharide deacetylase family protein [Chroogloeocystis siderophila]|jgi:peptidoglycan/xylan/chitin deacetylase (PgdA/CDA1 family)|uniref:NodB homology domain-containing protein n=1 Tax=Chroogloeocystis siderophila 5.2 s.c.1 TaxID=247279 RepID=A0A1U7HM70_9CHRO|nr:polysaccharide deacetylase family protein [Chroogloeocystis siderophila]OKH24654.1 hypothetical protein NIES1031_15225 [Chroogloeocystis siderophila 5.2 s.c.1]
MNKSFSISWVLSVLLVTSVGLMSGANTSKAAIANQTPQVKAISVPTTFRGKTIAQVKLEHQKVIALTFDDGPSPYTLQVLNILKQNNIKATFFWIGKSLQSHQQIAKQVVANGEAIGNHTWHHWQYLMKPNIAAQEIESTANLIYKITGVRTSLFRPPYGLLNNGVADYARQKRYVIVMWSVDPQDYRYKTSPQQLVNRIIPKIQPGSIVLMHDGGGNRSATVQALPQIISQLKQQGYRFVTVPQLLELKAEADSRIAKL